MIVMIGGTRTSWGQNLPTSSADPNEYGWVSERQPFERWKKDGHRHPVRPLRIFYLFTTLTPSTVLWVQLGLERAQYGGLTHSTVSSLIGPSLQYINYVLNKDGLQVGHRVNSSTTNICPVVIDPIPAIPGFPQLAGRRLILVDIPGFDDTFVDEVEILKRIAKWLAAS